MATSQQRFYQNNKEKVLAYKKEHYAKKSNKASNDLFRNIQMKGKTKSESRKIIKEAIHVGSLLINYEPPDDQHLFDESERWRTNWTPEQWIDATRASIRIDQKIITVEYKDDYREWIQIIFEPWMLVTLPPAEIL